MKINRKELLSVLELANKIPVYKGSFPVFDNIMLKTHADGIEVTCANHEMRFIAVVPAQGKLEECLVNRKLFVSTVKAMYDEEIELSMNNMNFQVRGSASNAYVRIPCMPAVGFPALKDNREKSHPLHNLTHERLRRFLKQGRGFTANDELRPMLSSMYIYNTPGLSGSIIGAASTDAHRLYHGFEEAECDVKWDMNIPNRAFNILDAILSKTTKIDVHQFGCSVTITSAKYQLIFDSIDGNFPNFAAVIPKPTDVRTNWMVNKSDLLAALNLAAVTQNPATKLIRFSAGHYLTLRSADMDYDLSSEQSIKVEKSGSDVEIGLKSEFLKSILSCIPTQMVKFSIVDATRAIIIEPDGKEYLFLTILMPMMITC